MNNTTECLIRAALLGCGIVCAAVSSQAQTNFAVLVNDGVWTWFNDPRALFHNGILYFGYNRAADGKVVLSALNLQSGNVSNLWTSVFSQTDDHDLPGLLAKQDGRLLAIYSRHLSDQFFAYRLSTTTNPVSSADWGAEQRISNSGAAMTYANPFQLSAESGKIYNFCRNFNYNPTVYTSTNAGATWSSPQILIQAGTGSTRPYVKYASDYTNRMDFLYTDGHPREVVNNSLYHLRYQSGAFYKTDGTFVKNYSGLPILHDSGERGSVIYQYSTAAQSDLNQWIPGGRSWCWEIASQTNGDPACVFSVMLTNAAGPTQGTDDRIYYYYARWTGASWQKRFIAQAGRPLYSVENDYAGGICLDPQNPNVIYISSDAANPFDLSSATNVPLRVHYEIWRGLTSDGGLTFAWTQITTNSSVDNLRPYIPRRFGGEQCVLWFRGTYTSYTSFNTQIVGLFSTAVPPGPITANGTWIADSDGLWSDTNKWSGGVPADGAGNTADFSALDITADRTVTLDSSHTIGSLDFGDILGVQNWLLISSNGSTLTLSGGAPLISVSQNTATLAVPLAGTAGFTKTGPGTLVLSASNSLSGTLNLDSGSTSANDGAVRITSSAALGNVVSPINFRNTTGSDAVGSFQMDGSGGGITVTQSFSTTCRNNNTTPTFESLAGINTLSGTNLVQAGGTSLIYQSDAGSLLFVTAPIQYVGSFVTPRTFIFTGDGDLTVSGAIRRSPNGAPVGVVKTGNGKLILSGANTYTNGTTVVGGTLQISGSLTNGRVTVTAGTLSGTGTIAGAVTISSGGTLAPGGDGIGTLTINNTLTNNGVIAITVDKTGSALTNDSIKGVTTFMSGGTLNVMNIGSGVLTVSDNFKFVSAASYKGAFTTISPATPGTGLVWNTNNLAVNGTLAVALGTISPQISQISLDGTNLVLSGFGGAAGYNYSVLSSTNLVVPVTNWDVVGIGNFDSSGGFISTNNVDPQEVQRFYVIRVP